MKTSSIQKELFLLQEESVKKLSQAITPNIDPSTIIGIRIPKLRALAKQLYKENAYGDFLKDLPHQYMEENHLHGLLINEMKDYDTVIHALYDFLPYVDNWATCDTIKPKPFKSHPKDLLNQVQRWIIDAHEYTVRYGIGVLLAYYLDEAFEKRHLKWVVQIKREEYYINMMRAWYFATALAKQYDATIPILEKQQLDIWTHNKTIQKAIESYRITDTQKEYLRSLKRNKGAK